MRRIKSLILAFSLLFVADNAFAQALPTVRDCSIASLSGSSQSLLPAANYQRKWLMVCNFGTSNSVGVNFAGGTAAIAGAGTFTLPDTGGPAAQCREFRINDLDIPSNAITVIGTAGQPVQCWEGR